MKIRKVVCINVRELIKEPLYLTYGKVYDHIDYDDGIISKKVYKKTAENIRDKVFVHSSISVANHVYDHVKNYVKFGSK